MKNIWYTIAAIIVSAGLFGSAFALANHFDTSLPINTPNDSVADNSDDIDTEEPEEKVTYTGVLCKDIAELTTGDKIVIVALGHNAALSRVQNTSNRGEAKVEKVEETVAFSDGVEVIILEMGHYENTFALKTETGYLYASSSSSNQLKTRDEVNTDNALWSIDFDSSGEANIVAQGTSTRNVLRYNSKSNLFSCYESTETQEPVVIYKLVESEEN